MQSLTVWRNNRLDQEESIPLEQLAEAFLKSEYADAEMLLERSVSLYLSNVEHASWDDIEAFRALCDMIVDRRQRRRLSTVQLQCVFSASSREGHPAWLVEQDT